MACVQLMMQPMNNHGCRLCQGRHVSVWTGDFVSNSLRDSQSGSSPGEVRVHQLPPPHDRAFTIPKGALLWGRTPAW